MYSVVVGTGAYMLLLSNFITLVILLRKQFKQWINTSFYILSTSDILYSILTASILLANHIVKITDTNYNEHNNILSLNDIAWNQKEKNREDHQDSYRQFGEHYSTVTESNFNVTSPCNVTNVIMQYAMLFVPLTNSFVSLLTFSMQCNLNVSCFKNQCNKFLQSQKNNTENKFSESIEQPQLYSTEKYNEHVTDCELKTPVTEFDSKLNSVEQGSTSTVEKIRSINWKRLQTFQLNGLKKNDGIVVSMLIISQWIIPILVTGVLYFAEYSSMNYIKHTENAVCSIKNNFLFDNCDNNIQTMNLTQNVYAIPSDNHYIINDDLKTLPNTNDTQVNEIISKVQSIVHSVINGTPNISNNARPTTFYNNSELLDVIKYMETDKIMNDKHDETNVNFGSNSTEDVSTHNSFTHGQNDYNQLQSRNNTDEYSTELLLFNNLIKNISQETESTKGSTLNDQITTNTPESSYSDYEIGIQTHFLDKSQNTTQQIMEITTKHTTLAVSNDQIYAEILKRIHGITEQNVLKDRYKNNWSYMKKQPKQTKFEEQTLQNNSESQKGVLSIVKIDVYENDDIPKMMPCMANKCFISDKFLKLHLLVLVFIIYFLPILLSSILQVHGKVTCQVVLDRLKTNSKILFKNANSDISKEANSISFNNVTNSEKICGPSRWFPECNEGNLDEESNEDSEILQQIQASEVHSSKSKNDKTSYNGEQKYTDMIEQTKNIQKLFDMIKISLICGTLLWTPIFLEVLLEVFLCLHVPKWLLNLTYLCAITFGILRNIFNLKMIKLQGINTSPRKINCIHPTN